MNVLIAAGAVFTLVGLLFLIATLRHFRRGRLLRAGSSLVAAAMSASLGAVAAMVLISYLGYERLTDEQLVGVIEFSRNAPDEFTARLARLAAKETNWTLSCVLSE